MLCSSALVRWACWLCGGGGGCCCCCFVISRVSSRKKDSKTAFIRTMPLFVYLDSELFRAFLVNIRLALARYALSKKIPPTTISSLMNEFRVGYHRKILSLIFYEKRFSIQCKISKYWNGKKLLGICFDSKHFLSAIRGLYSREYYPECITQERSVRYWKCRSSSFKRHKSRMKK